jgi:hypothetical protein
MIEAKHTTKTFMAPVIAGGLLILIIGGVLAFGGCTHNTYNIPPKLFPAYTLSIQFPGDVGTITTEPGATVILPVNVRSLVDVPISIRLTQEHNIVSPDFISLRGPDEYSVLQPGDNVTIAVTCIISDNATPGTYNTAIGGELKEPVANRSGESWGFRVIITNKKTER